MVSNLFHNIVFLNTAEIVFVTFFVNYFLNGRIVRFKEISVISVTTLIYWYILFELRKKYPYNNK